jgi:hypothetical protein
MTFFEPNTNPDDRSQTCPICGLGQSASARYPNYLCKTCVAKATDAQGKRLEFFNAGAYGGFGANFVDSALAYSSHECFVDGVACRADEARFGGIVLEPIKALIQARDQA